MPLYLSKRKRSCVVSTIKQQLLSPIWRGQQQSIETKGHQIFIFTFFLRKKNTADFFSLSRLTKIYFRLSLSLDYLQPLKQQRFCNRSGQNAATIESLEAEFGNVHWKTSVCIASFTKIMMGWSVVEYCPVDLTDFAVKVSINL